MNTRREFLKYASVLSGGAGLMNMLPPAIQKAMAIDPAPGTTFMDAEHIVFLMQENRSFDHAYGTLQGVRGFNDPRAIRLPNNNLVWLQSNKEGDTYAPFRLNIKDTKATWMSSLPHSWSNQVDARNDGKYDKWLDSKRSGHKEYASMPLTLGFYNREDIPFYYALADAFTVCDQHFCSSLTGTTPNRLYFWTGTIRERADADALARVWNEDADYDTEVSWTTFPERLEEWGISWKVYQNEVSAGVGFEGEEDSWLANFGDNPLEYFTQYKVRLSKAYINNLPKEAAALTAEIKKQEQQLNTVSASAQKIKDTIDRLKKRLAKNEEEQKIYTRERYERLSEREKNIHDKAFSTNYKDPFYHDLTSLRYHDGTTEREVKVPKGDVLHQFREDVKNGKLPAVSWVVAPENFSDHPSAAWYGAWYISEVLDILTQNPEVWKKTIFILTYDENDGYFDHVPPFVAPHPHKQQTGAVSAGIDTGVEYVANTAQQSISSLARESSIGLGYRVPLVVASPWSRGGWVCSEVFDHTSSLQFLEKVLAKKTGKKIEEPNISAWRRTVCGDLTSVFRPYNGEKIILPTPVTRDPFIEGIHKAQFKGVPNSFKKLTAEEIARINANPTGIAFQEKGIRSSCALPYELYADAALGNDKKAITVILTASRDMLGNEASGSPFTIYVPGKNMVTRNYAVAAGDTLKDDWQLSDFDNEHYHLCVHGPNGFFREISGHATDELEVRCLYERVKSGKRLSGNIVLHIQNTGNNPQSIEVADNAYKTAVQHITVTGKKSAMVVVNSFKSHCWYDCTVRIKGNTSYERRYAGRVETGLPGKTDPFMGQMV